MSHRPRDRCTQLLRGLAGFCLLSFSLGMTIPEVPNPTVSGRYVEDAGGVLGRAYVALIDGLCQALERATSAELVVSIADLAKCRTLINLG